MICLAILLLSLVSVSHLTNIRPDLGAGFVHVYDLGCDIPKGKLGISKVTIKDSNEKPHGLFCDQKNLYMGKSHTKHFGLRCVHPLFSSDKNSLEYMSQNDLLHVSLAGDSTDFQIKGHTGIMINLIRGTIKENYFVNENSTLSILSREGDEFQIIDPFGFVDTIVGFKLGKVKATAMKGENLVELNFKFSSITSDKLSADRPVVKEILSTSLEKGSHRFKWFANENNVLLLPSATYPNGIMEFTESTFIFSGKSSESSTRVKLVGDRLETAIDRDSPFSVLVRSKKAVFKGKVTPETFQCFTSRDSPFSIVKVKKDDEVVIFNFFQMLDSILSKYTFSTTKEELIEKLKLHSSADNIYIAAQIAENTMIPRLQETKSTNSTNNNIFDVDPSKNNKKSKKKSKSSQKHAPKTSNKTAPKEPKKKVEKEKEPDLNSNKDSQALGNILSNDHVIKTTDNNHKIDSIQELSDRLEKTNLLQSPECELKGSFPTFDLNGASSSKSNLDSEFIHVYDLGLADPKGELGISKVTIKNLDKNLHGLFCDQKSLYIRKDDRCHFGLKYASENSDNAFTHIYHQEVSENAFGLLIDLESGELHIKGPSGTKMVHIHETDKDSYFLEENCIKFITDVRDGDEFQIINPFGLTDTIIGLKLGMVRKDKILKAKNSDELNSKFQTITKYKLSNKKPIVTEIISKPLEKESHRFKWFADEKKRSLLPSVTFPNGTLEFTESMLVFSSKSSDPAAILIKLVKNNLQITISENSPFLVMIKPNKSRPKEKNLSKQCRIITSQTSSTIKVKSGYEIIVFNFYQERATILANSVFPKTEKELIEQLESHSLADNIYITAQIVENTKIPKVQKNELRDTINKKNSDTGKKSDTKSKLKQCQNHKPETFDEINPFGSEKKANRENENDLNSGEKTRPLKNRSLVDSSPRNQISKQNTVEPNDQIIDIDPVDNEISVRLEKISLLQPPKYKLKKSLSANNLRETAEFYTLPNPNLLKQTNLEELD